MSIEWESVSAPQGTFFGWGIEPGQHATGTVLSYTADGGRDFDKKPCPEVVVKLTEPAVTFRKGQPVELEAGDVVRVTCDKAVLKDRIVTANPNYGDYVKIVFKGTAPSDKGSPVKLFDVLIPKGRHVVPVKRPNIPAESSFEDYSAEPPF